MNIYQLKTEQDKAHFRELSIQYFLWYIPEIEAHTGIPIDADGIDGANDSMKSLEKMMPPQGHFLLCDIDGEIAGMAGLRALSDTAAEIKRVYVRPKFRGKGISRTILQQLISHAEAEDYTCIRLDTANFNIAAQGLFRSLGFEEIEPYEGTGCPEAWYPYWLFFERSLR